MAGGVEFNSRLKKKINERLDALKDNILQGQTEDYAKYRELVGRVQSCIEILALCDETESDINKGN